MSEFPKLMWAPDGREFTVQDQAEQDMRAAEGFRLTREAAPVKPVTHAATKAPEFVAHSAHVKPEATPASGPLPPDQPPVPDDPRKAKK